MRAKITDRYIKESVRRSFSSKINVEVRDETLAGSVLVIRSSSALSFSVRFRDESGHPNEFTIGKCGSVTTTKARQMAQSKIGELKDGIDIPQERMTSGRRVERAELRRVRGFLLSISRLVEHGAKIRRSDTRSSPCEHQHFVRPATRRYQLVASNKLANGYTNIRRTAGYDK
jgi:hypothetical protein